MLDDELSITWGDGGVHRGPLTVRPAGIEFYGKRYSRPGSATTADLVGTWEAAQGTAVGGGDGINRLSTLIVEADGRYRWAETVGGVVDGEASAGGDSWTGTLSISGQTVTFDADDGALDVRTFLPVPGEPLSAFSLDDDLFTRVE